MEYEEKTKFYQEIKNVFAKESVLPYDKLKEELKVSQEKLDLFLGDNLLYVREGEEVKRVKEIKFKVLKISSDVDLDAKILDLRKELENKFGEIAYLRFNQNEGHIVVTLDKSDKIISEKV